MKRALITPAVMVLGVASIGVFGQLRRAHRENARQTAIDRFTAAHPLERAAASIDWARQDGQTSHFALVPQTRPPGVVAMEPYQALADNGVTDVYSYDGFKVVVNFTAVPGVRPCADQPCLRDADFTVRTADAPSLHHAAVWFLGTPPPATPEIAKFWTTTAWVPIATATWFTDLAIRGEVYGRH
ncbi:hypothetical protein ACWKSP_00630 [Micromonosporaceae bacterium Da 78-11]